MGSKGGGGDIDYPPYAPAGEYTSNSDNVLAGIGVNPDAGPDWQPARVRNIDFGNTPAPKGRAIINVFDYDIEDAFGIGGLPEQERVFGPSTVASYTGRAWYAGFSGRNYEEKVLFSTVLTDTKIVADPSGLYVDEKAARCYQLQDPTVEDLNDLLANDGGSIEIPNAGRILHLAPILQSLIVIATNGVWEISGGFDSFSASTLSVGKVTTIGGLDSSSIVEVENGVVYWADSGIFVVTPDPQASRFVSQSITESSIDQFYEDIPFTSRVRAEGYYEELERKIYWLYSADASNTKQNRCLIYDVVLQAFTKYSFPGVLNYPIGQVCLAYQLSDTFDLYGQDLDHGTPYRRFIQKYKNDYLVNIGTGGSEVFAVVDASTLAIGDQSFGGGLVGWNTIGALSKGDSVYFLSEFLADNVNILKGDTQTYVQSTVNANLLSLGNVLGIVSSAGRVVVVSVIAAGFGTTALDGSTTKTLININDADSGELISQWNGQNTSPLHEGEGQLIGGLNRRLRFNYLVNPDGSGGYVFQVTQNIDNETVQHDLIKLSPSGALEEDGFEGFVLNTESTTVDKYVDIQSVYTTTLAGTYDPRLAPPIPDIVFAHYELDYFIFTDGVDNTLFYVYDKGSVKTIQAPRAFTFTNRFKQPTLTTSNKPITNVIYTQVVDRVGSNPDYKPTIENFYFNTITEEFSSEFIELCPRDFATSRPDPMAQAFMVYDADLDAGIDLVKYSGEDTMRIAKGFMHLQTEVDDKVLSQFFRKSGVTKEAVLQDVVVNDDAVVADSVEVVANTGFREINSEVEPYLSYVDDDGYINFATFDSEDSGNYHDWVPVEVSDALGVEPIAPISAYIEVGDNTLGELMREKQAIYVYSYLEVLENYAYPIATLASSRSGFTYNPVFSDEFLPLDKSDINLSGRWSWHIEDSSGRWSKPQRAYRSAKLSGYEGYVAPTNLSINLNDYLSNKTHPGFRRDVANSFPIKPEKSVSVSRLKIRGMGKSINLYYSNVPGRGFKLLAWAAPIVSNENV